jgi:hypothetical protein
MRTALLTVALLETLALADPAQAAFRCFDTPDNGFRCACVGSGECDELLKSGDCKSKPHCDNAELGPVICSCKAAGAAKSTH